MRSMQVACTGTTHNEGRSNRFEGLGRAITPSFLDWKTLCAQVVTEDDADRRRVDQDMTSWHWGGLIMARC